MKSYRKLLALLLSLSMFCLTGCGAYIEADIDQSGVQTITSEAVFLTKDDLTNYGLELSDLGNYQIAVNDNTGEKYYVVSASDNDVVSLEDFPNIKNIVNLKNGASVKDSGGIFNSKKFEYSLYTYGVSDKNLNTRKTIFNDSAFLYYSLTFPYKVLKANGEISSDGYTVTYDLDTMEAKNGDKGYRVYAVFDESAATAKDLTIKGAASGKVYSDSRNITVSSTGTVTMLRLNGKTISGRTCSVTGNGDYTLYVKLLSGVSKKISFSIKRYYKLTYKVNGGKALKKSTKTVRYGNKYGKLAVPVRKGYKFLGWYTKKSGGSKLSAKTVCRKSRTLYAHWKKVKS